MMRHSLAVAVLSIGVITAALRALLMARPGGTKRVATGGLATILGAVPVASVASRAECELTTAPAADDVTMRFHPATGRKLDADPESCDSRSGVAKAIHPEERESDLGR